MTAGSEWQMNRNRTGIDDLLDDAQVLHSEHADLDHTAEQTRIARRLAWSRGT